MICENCGKEHDGSYGSGRFCCSKCAHMYSTKFEIKKLKKVYCYKCGAEIYIDKRVPSKKQRLCEKCKEKEKLSMQNCKIMHQICNDNCILYKHNFCNKSRSGIVQRINTLIKYFQFELSNDEEQILKEFYKIKNLIQFDIDSGLSSNEICLKYTGSYKKGNNIFNILNIKTRSLSDSIKNAILFKKILIPISTYKFKTEWHTTWDNKTYFLRSSYETNYANELDKKQIKYSVESLRIQYFDTEKNINRIAIPDFYLIDLNTIVEIKSLYTLNIQNMRDKANAYIANNYNFKLIVDGLEIDIFSL